MSWSNLLRPQVKVERGSDSDYQANRYGDAHELNVAYNLPFSGIGDTARGLDFEARQVGYDAYDVRVDDGLFSTGQTMTVDAEMMHKIIVGEHLPNMGLYRMTDDERRELSELENSMVAWRKRNKLEKFKKLPAHLRQEIVNEAIIGDLIEDIHANDGAEDGGFEDYERLTELRNKERPSMRMHYSHQYNIDTTSPSRYAPIISQFSTDELMEAHAEATLEDEIAD